MRILKESILNRSNHTGEGFKAQRRKEIEDWLKEHNIRNYTINDDSTIDVSEDISFEIQILKEFPEYIQFGVVEGFFDCSYCHLKSLRGVPRIVKGCFDCADNELTSLEGAPREVGGDFSCIHNPTSFTEKDVKSICNVVEVIIC